MPVPVRARVYLALVAFALFAIPSGVVAQGTGTIDGTVIDAGNRRPVSGVQISIVGTGGTVGSVTNAQGAFRILNVAPGQRTVRARLIGYSPTTKAVEVVAGGTATVALELSQSAIELSAVVTTGTGGSQVEARKLGNTVASVEAPQNAPISSFSDILQGREPGVMALPSSGTTGEGTRIRIRGNASLSQSNEPIVYVDGVRIDNGGGFGGGYVGTGGGGRPSRLDDIDPTVIEKIEVLKGAAAATLYGTEASNGVLLITTKKGAVAPARWTLEVEQGMKTYPEGRIEDQWGVPANSLTPAGARRCAAPVTQACADAQAARLSQHYGTSLSAFAPFKRDVATQLFETGSATTVGGQVTGGTPLVTYFGGVRGYMENGPFTAKNMDWKDINGNKRGVLMKDIANRYTGTVTLGLTPARAFKLQTTTLYAQSHNEIPENANSIYAPYTVALFSKPENAQCEASVAAGLAVATAGSMGNGFCAGQGNPTGASTFGSMRELVQRTIKQDARHFNGHLRASYIPTSAFNLDGTFGVDYTHTRSTAFLPFGNNVDLRTNQANGGDADLDDRAHQEITLSVNGGYTRDFPMTLSSNLIFGAQGFLTRDNEESSTNQGFPGPGIEVVGAGSSPLNFESFSSIVNAGYFAQEQLGYADWLFGTLGGRYDYNSAFGKTSGGVFYPQASISVIPSDRASWRESFLGNYLSTLRFRAAIGKAGRQPSAFDKLTTYTALTATTGAGLVPSNLGNPELRPEVSTEVEAGAEFGIREDQTSFAFTRWQRSTIDALYARQFPVTGGFRAAQIDNIGQIKAWGWDARVKSFVINRPNLSADVYGNIGFLSQLVKSLGGAPPVKVGGSYPRYRNFVIEGYAPGAFFSAKAPGACPAGSTSQFLPKQSTTPASKTTGGVCLMPGQLPFDTDANGIPDTQAQVLAFLGTPRLLTAISPMLADDDNDADKLDHYNGKPLPDFEGSFGGSATIRKNWRVGTNLEYRVGNYTISDLTGAFRRASPSNGGNTQARAEVEGIMMNPASTAQQRVDAALRSASSLYGLSPADGMNQHFDGDFLRWRELSLTYQAPQSWASKAGAADMQITFAARNFALWTKYPGVDPEVNLLGRSARGGTDNNFAESIDAFGFPLPRMFSFNVRMGF
jgi:TonB-dependent starch-binding outer membrane protein SusC